MFDLEGYELTPGDLFNLKKYLTVNDEYLSDRRALTEPTSTYDLQGAEETASLTYDSELASMLAQSFDRGTRTGNDGAALRPWLDVDGHST